jgi:hypothetical protein
MPATPKKPVYKGSGPYPCKLDVKAELAAMHRAHKRIMKTSASRIAFLQRAGIFDETGKLAKEYR